MIRNCSLSTADKAMQALNKTKSEANEIVKIKSRALTILEEPRMTPTDCFLI